MRNWISCLILAVSVPGAVSAQTVDYQVQLASGEVGLNVSGSGSYVQRGNVVRLSGQLTADAASVVDADALNQENFDLLVNSLGMLGVDATQIRKSAIAPEGEAPAGLTRSTWQLSVELYDQTRLGEIVSALEGADVRSIQPPQYDVADRAALIAAARQRAVEDAKRQAESYATALTMVVRRIVLINETAASVTVAGARSDLAGEGDVVATASVDVDFVLGPMFGATGTP